MEREFGSSVSYNVRGLSLLVLNSDCFFLFPWFQSSGTPVLILFVFNICI